MTTDVISTLRTTEEYLRAVQLSYNPVALAISRQIKHDMTNDVKVVFKRLDVERDNIIAQNLTMGQTEVAAIKANETSKVFNKYVKGAKITQSVYNFNFNRIPELVSKIIRGYSMIFDNITLYGDGLNNGILTTSDPNNVVNDSIEIDATADIMGLANQVVDIISGLKQQVREYTASTDVLVYVYGGQLVRCWIRLCTTAQPSAKSSKRHGRKQTLLLFLKLSLPEIRWASRSFHRTLLP